MNNSLTVGTCGHCCQPENYFLHHVHHNGIFRRLCTTCVLRLHPHSFCPTCFTLHDTPTLLIPLLPSSNDTVSCFKCFSSSHIPCVGPAPTNPYLCPLCVNPNSPPLFVLKDSVNGFKAVDFKAARVLLAAAKIAAATMNKAAAVAEAAAEMRAKEAVRARERAMEAVESLHMDDMGNVDNNDLFVRDNNHKNNNNVFGERIRVDRVDNTSAVLAAFNAVEMREKERADRALIEFGVLIRNQEDFNGGVSADLSLRLNGGVSGDLSLRLNGNNRLAQNGTLPGLRVELGSGYIDDENVARNRNVGSQRP